MRALILAVLTSVGTCSGVVADELGLATYYENVAHGGLTAAHLTLPMGTRVRVHNLENGRDVVVTIVDRGPHAAGRIIDVSTPAADALGMRQSGVARVRLEIFQPAAWVETACAAPISPRNRSAVRRPLESSCAPIAPATRGPE